MTPLETGKFARGNTVSLRPKHVHQSSVEPHSTDNKCKSVVIAGNQEKKTDLMNLSFSLFGKLSEPLILTR